MLEKKETGACCGTGDDRAVAELLGLRLVLYGLGARLFAAEPDEEALLWCRRSEVPEALALLEAVIDEDGDRSQADPGMSQRWIRICGEKAVISAEEAKAAYTKLFVGPHRPPAAPWESVHLSADGLLFQESTLRVRQAYRAAGFKAAGYPHEPDDHLGTELSFMAALAASSMEKWRAGDTVGARADLMIQQRFLDDHLCRWVPLFCSSVAAAPDKLRVNEFYVVAAEMVSLLVKADRALLSELLRNLWPAEAD